MESLNRSEKVVILKLKCNMYSFLKEIQTLSFALSAFKLEFNKFAKDNIQS